MPESKSAWERTVELTIAVGERILAPIERFIGKRSLVGDATFFELERFPWVKHIEDNWEVILQELQGVLADREALPNFQDISKDQIEITDDDRWKTFFLYGYGFEGPEFGEVFAPWSSMYCLLLISAWSMSSTKPFFMILSMAYLPRSVTVRALHWRPGP